MKKLILPLLTLISLNVCGQNILPETGNVGIGTTVPTVKLHVNNGDNSYGTILANASEAKFSLYAKTLTTEASKESFRLGLKYETNENNGFISFYRGASIDGGFLGFSTNGEERIRINADGKVGIGINTPNEKLVVQATEEDLIARFQNLEASDTVKGIRVNSRNTDNRLRYLDIAIDAENDKAGIGIGTGAPNLPIGKTDLSNAQIVINRDDGSIGIGTTEPLAKLHVNNGDNSYGTILANASEPEFSLYAKTLTTILDTNIEPFIESFRLGLKHLVNEDNGYISFYRGNTFDGGFLGFSTDGQERIRINADGNVGIGTNNTEGYKLAVAGTTGIIAEKVTVKLYDNVKGWPDYVFSKGYKLPTLKEVEKFITKKGHLKNIPSAKEIEKKGSFELGEMNVKLLKKIEELTLYTIQQQKEIEAEQEKNNSLEERIKKIEKLLQK